MSDTLTRTSKPEPMRPVNGSAMWPEIVQGVVLLALVWFVFSRALDFFVYKWRVDANWSHGWLVPFFSLYFIWNDREKIACRWRRSIALELILGSAVVFVSLAWYYYFSLKGIAYLQHIAIIPCLIGIVHAMFGWGVLRLAWFPIAFLLCAIPLPHGYYFRFTLPLRQLASQVAGAILGLLPGVDTEVQGVVIDYFHGDTGTLNVEEACSGMRLMMAFCTLGLAMAYLGDRPLWQRMVMVICCAPIAVFCNSLRVTITGILHVYGYRELAEGTAHMLLGLAMLPIALGLFALVGYILKNLFVEAGEDEEDDETLSPADA